MNNDQFDAYVSKLDTIAKRNSRVFLIRVLTLAIVGYIILFMFLVGGIASFVARKSVQHFQKAHYHVILVVSKDPWYLPSSSYHQRLLKRLLANLQLESSYFLMVEDSSSKKIAKRVRKIPNAFVYSNV